MKILFLDIDGVLNQHIIAASGACGIDPACAARLNRVIGATDCQLVISSAWRYMISGGAMTLKGFEYLLLTHGLNARDRLLGITCPDETIYERGAQIRRWLTEHAELAASMGHVTVRFNWAVVDDDPMNMRLGDDAWRLVKTDGNVGLTDEHVEQLISILDK